MELKDIFSRIRELKKGIPIRYKSKSVRFGENKSAFKGSGYEIAEISRWREGEPLKNISWGLSIRDFPKKIYKVEKIENKEIPVIIFVDISNSILFQISETSNNAQLLLELIGIIGLTCARFQDPVGLVGFSDRVNIYLKPKPSRSYVFYMIKLIFDRIESIKGELKSKDNTDINQALKVLIGKKGKISAIFISDFVNLINEEESIDWKLLGNLSSRHNIIFIFLDDPLEFEWKMSLGVVPVKNLETGETDFIRGHLASKIRGDVERRRNFLIERLKKIRVNSIVLSYGSHVINLAKFFSQK